MATNYLLPITQPISNDTQMIIYAIDSRSDEIKKFNNSQNIIKRIIIAALPVIGLAAALVSIGSIPVAVILFTATMMPLAIAGINLGIALTCLTLSIVLNPTSPGETIIRKQWKDLFSALRKGDGELIIETCQELAKQKDGRKDSFKRCLGTLPADETTPFFHKICFVGYLLIAMQSQLKGDSEQSSFMVQKALPHFDGSGFSAEVMTFAKLMMDNPQDVQSLIELHSHSESRLHALDHMLVKHLKKKG